MDAALPVVIGFCVQSKKDAKRAGCVAQAWRNICIFNSKLIVPALEIDASRENYNQILQQVYLLRIRSLVLRGSAMDLTQLLNQITGIAITREFMHATHVDIVVSNVFSNIEDKHVVSFITAVSNLISALESRGGSLQYMGLDLKKLVQCSGLDLRPPVAIRQLDLQRLVAAFHGIGRLQLQVQVREFQAFKDHLLRSGNWSYDTGKKLFLRELPPDACVDAAAVHAIVTDGGAAARVRMYEAQLRAVSQRLYRLQDTEPPEDFALLLDRVGTLVDALDGATRGAADETVEMDELDKEISEILDTVDSASHAVEVISSRFGPS